MSVTYSEYIPLLTECLYGCTRHCLGLVQRMVWFRPENGFARPREWFGSVQRKEKQQELQRQTLTIMGRGVLFQSQPRLFALHPHFVSNPLQACKFFLCIVTHFLMEFGNGL